MQSHERMLKILDLFDAEGDYVALSFEEIQAQLGYSRSTLYRYLKALSDAGLLSSLPGLGFVLGSRIIQFDYKIRTGDPLIRASRPVMEELAVRYSAVALLCRRYKDEVLCVHQESGTDQILSRYERGRARPLLRGAASVAILAHLPPYHISRLHGLRADEFCEAGFGESLTEVRATLKAHRKRGWVETRGDVTVGVIGIAAPIFDGAQEVFGSLSLTLDGARTRQEDLELIAEQVMFCARIISNAMSSN